MSSPRHTYHPDYADLINWLMTPGGNLVWDVVLQALGVIITVFVIERWIEIREEKRWLPLKHQTYFLLFSTSESLVRNLSPHQPKESKADVYYFGDSAAVSGLTEEFGEELLKLNSESYVEVTKQIIDQHSNLLSDLYRKFNEDVGRGAVVIAREAELSKLRADLDLALGAAVRGLNSPEDKDSITFLALRFKWVAEAAYELNEWLKSQANATADATSMLEQLQDDRERRQTRKRPAQD